MHPEWQHTGEGLESWISGTMIGRVQEKLRFRTLNGFDGNERQLTPVSGWLGSGAEEGRAKLR